MHPHTSCPCISTPRTPNPSIHSSLFITVVLHFLECHMSGITLCVAFPARVPCLGIHACGCTSQQLLRSLCRAPRCGCGRADRFTRGRILGLPPVWVTVTKAAPNTLCGVLREYWCFSPIRKHLTVEGLCCVACVLLFPKDTWPQESPLAGCRKHPPASWLLLLAASYASRLGAETRPQASVYSSQWAESNLLPRASEAASGVLWWNSLYCCF